MITSSRALSSRPTVSGRRTSGLLGLAAAVTVAAAMSLAPAPGASAADGPARTVTVIDREDIALSGAASLSELLGGRAGFNSFGLHGALLGTGSSTTLVNGRPVAGLNLTTLPLSAVERVEILDQGPVRHSAFGIGRTTNIVLRNEFEGVEITAAAGRPS